MRRSSPSFVEFLKDHFSKIVDTKLLMTNSSTQTGEITAPLSSA
jgi:hypothetical protein